MTTIHLEADFLFPVRAHKGERRAKGGLLIKCIQFNADTLAEAEAELAATVKVLNSAKLIAKRAFDREAFRADPLKARPFFAEGFAY